MRRTAPRLALLLAIALAGAACGSSKDTGFPPPANESPTPSPTEDENGGGGELTGPIDVVDNSYEPLAPTVKVGTAVEWLQSGSAPHSVTTDPGQEVEFNSHPRCSFQDINSCMLEGDAFSFTFETPGEFLYYCVIHGAPNGVGMAAKIIVEG